MYRYRKPILVRIKRKIKKEYAKTQWLLQFYSKIIFYMELKENLKIHTRRKKTFE